MRPFIWILITGLLFAGCKKKYAGDESVLHGTWVKGANFGDTLWFMTRNNKQIMRHAMSFNPGMPVYEESEYRYEDGRLSVKLYAPYSQDYVPITSFQWTNMATEFSIRGIEIYSFMSASGTVFTYHKIN
ncbi:MAG TPA: hypothetical protein VFI06_09050 [Chitinophagaceae bacterium]|nr:hypothetical protein [Chitinophagaceae bacterium]